MKIKNTKVKMDSLSLLLEIGVCEMPVGYIKPAVNMLSTNLSKKLLATRIAHGSIKVFATPRRLAVLVRDVALKQRNNVEQIHGPPEKIAFDESGEYTIQAIRFAEKIGVPLDKLEVISTDKGRYISAKKTDHGRLSKTLLQTILPELILSIPFPKVMRWSDLSVSFARPIRTVVSILGSEVVSFSLDNKIMSGRNSTGHLLMSPDKVPIYDPNNYLEIMRKVNVIADFKERRDLIFEAINQAAYSIGGEILYDDALLDIVTNLVEFPTVITGKFDNFFLNIPREILVMAMREHQKCFAVIDKKGVLMPGFVAVNNTISSNIKLIVAGYERVLRARLSDAKFFYDSDCTVSMDTWVEKLRSALFYSGLGSMYDKVLRIQALALYLADIFAIEFTEDVSRAAYLCKSDLVSKVVIEFPKLQGTMGAIYSRLSGESETVSLAIKEHYWPIKSGGQLPTTKVGALVSIADKIDSICGCFVIGLIPTGAADPYALRRQAIGLLQIIRTMNFDLSIWNLIEKSVAKYNNKSEEDLKIVVNKVSSFLWDRFSVLLLNEGYSYDIVAAVFSLLPISVGEIDKRVFALESFKKTNDYVTVIAMFKRIDKMVCNAKFVKVDISEDLFENKTEVMLYKAYIAVSKKVDLYLSNGNIKGALSSMILLADPVALFFERVMVMVDDKSLRQNRLILMDYILKIFYKIADFSKISI